MAILNAAWTEDQTLQAAQTLSASGSDTDDLDLDVNGYDAVEIQWIGTFNASATEGCTIEVFGSPDSGGNEDTIALASQEVEVDPGNTVKISIPIQDVPYLAIKRTNNDGSYDITDETVRYAGRKWETT